MKSAEFLTENTTRLHVKTTTTGPRTFFEGYLNPDSDPTPTWLRILSKAPLAVESTAEITQGDTCYIGHIQAHQSGKGYASDLVKYIIDYYKKQSIHKFYAYINHANVNSQNLFRKAGFVEAIKKREGSFWELNTSLNELNWMSESLSHLSVDNRLAFLGELLTKKGILTESSDTDCVEYLMNLKDISIQPEKNKSYMISLLSLVDNQLLQMHPMFIGKVLDIIDDQYKIEMADGRVLMFPDKRISEKMATCTFFFAGQLSYDKFKTAIRLKFNTDLTEHHLRTCYS